MHPTDQSIEDSLFCTRHAVVEACLAVDGRPDAVGMLSLQQTSISAARLHNCRHNQINEHAKSSTCVHTL